MSALKPLGQTFASELAAAGLLTLPISWGSDGQISGVEALQEGDRIALDAVIAAHDPVAVRLDDYRLAIQAHVDATAQARQYDSGITCASYVGSTNSAWAAEAQAFVAWRDAVWGHAYGELAQVASGQREQPTIDALLVELPAMIWPV